MPYKSVALVSFCAEKAILAFSSQRVALQPSQKPTVLARARESEFATLRARSLSPKYTYFGLRLIKLTGSVLSFVLLACAAQVRAERMELPNGDIYDGETLGDQRHGRGTYRWRNGDVYVGEFVTNTMHGEGTFTWADGRSYEGQFVQDRREGKGQLTWPNGDVYQGDFRNNYMHGRGEFVWANLDRYQGNFIQNRRTGAGVFNWADGASYEGQFQDGVLHGVGIYRWLDGREYRGEFVKGVKTGRGTLRWANGNRYAGQFQSDQRAGLGVQYWRDGTVYRGHFADGKMHGLGVKRLPDGELELQQWSNGVLNVSEPVREHAHCQFILADKLWMFTSPSCVNGKAHGQGLAVSLDGSLLIPDGRFVLGNLVIGSTLTLPEIDPNLINDGSEQGSDGG